MSMNRRMEELAATGLIAALSLGLGVAQAADAARRQRSRCTGTAQGRSQTDEKHTVKKVLKVKHASKAAPAAKPDATPAS